MVVLRQNLHWSTLSSFPKNSIVRRKERCLENTFGLRTDLTKRGVDIDILIISERIKKSDLVDIRWSFFEEFGEQKMDIVTDDGSTQTPFVKMYFPRQYSYEHRQSS